MLRNDDDDEDDDNGNDCFPDLAEELESAGVDRGHEFAESLITLTRHIRDANELDDVELDSPAFLHSLGHVLEGLIGGLADHFSDELQMDLDDISRAMAAALDDPSSVPGFAPAEDLHLHGAGSSPSLSGDQFQALRERLAAGGGYGVGLSPEEVNQNLDEAVAGAVRWLRESGMESGGRRVDPVIVEGLVLMSLTGVVVQRLRQLPDVGIALARMLEDQLTKDSDEAESSAAEGAADTSREAIGRAMQAGSKSAPKAGQGKGEPPKTGGRP